MICGGVPQTDRELSEDPNYIANYKSGRLYVNPKSNRGAYASLAEEGEVIIDELDVGTRFKLCVSAFYVADRKDFGTFKIHKLRFHKTRGWQLDGSITLNGFQLEKIRRLTEVIASLDLADAQKTRLDLSQISIERLADLLDSDKAEEFAEKLAHSPNLKSDIFALEAKRRTLCEFENLLTEERSEADWQAFFERNQWIFGIGLNFVPLTQVAKKLEATTTGFEFDQPGKRTDALMKTRAEISQFVLAEIKRPDTPLLEKRSYRSGCWAISNELAGAVAQCQKTVFEFEQKRFEVFLKDAGGNRLDEVYSVKPKSFIVIGNLKELAKNTDKIASFELFRKNVSSPEIVTFDELFGRAKALLENVSTAKQPKDIPDEVPF